MVTRANTTWPFVQFNSFVHTIMYAYYAYTALGYRVSNKYKSFVTKLQLTSFYIGVPINAFGIWRYWRCSTGPEHILGIFALYFLSSLIVLFNIFYKNTYAKPKQKVKKKEN